ncbi:MAG: AlpA family phage regulatory protein [Zhongshania sp.]|jgi:prophage regulatory protein|nr:AlpA family phage regulatory protein [Zhongshania sp.]
MAAQIREALLRRKQVEARTGLPRSSLYALISANKFPKPIILSGRTVAWVESSVDQWVAERIAASKEVA